jgi:hypothetical protein
MTTDDPWSELALAARPAGRARRRALVPVLGSGLLMQAFREGPDRGERMPLDWASLLATIAQDAGLERPRKLLKERDVPGQGTLLWESMVLERVATAPDEGAAYRHELSLRKLVARRLVEHADSRAARERCQPFLDRFFALGFDDVVTFDFDDWLSPGAVPAREAKVGRPGLHVLRGNTRIWHPHGHAARSQGIVLGARAYGVALSELAAAFGRHVAKERKSNAAHVHRVGTVVDAVIDRPLLLLGLSLSREEWTIWWLLTQRARFLARHRVRPPVFVLARRPAPDEPVEAQAQFATLHRYAALLGLRLLEASSWPDAWRKLRAALPF